MMTAEFEQKVHQMDTEALVDFALGTLDSAGILFRDLPGIEPFFILLELLGVRFQL